MFHQARAAVHGHNLINSMTSLGSDVSDSVTPLDDIFGSIGDRNSQQSGAEGENYVANVHFFSPKTVKINDIIALFIYFVNIF